MVTLTDTEPLQSQLDGIIFATHQLETVNLSIDDKTLTYLLALHLPESYTTLCTVLTSANSATMTSKWVSDQIITEEHHWIAQSGGSTTAFFAKAKGKSSGGTSDAPITCNYCKKLGHKKVDCRKRKKDKEEREAAAKASGSSTANSGNNSSKSTSSGNSSTSCCRKLLVH
jgi:hypothetical protein